ncbi:hypothetical protein AVEN_111720-1 [Araneus ventricosus]|uniref:Uncharacterized protein n=1 Tax=Araneus ventricosus TaxID=182803 RepID=A0A4Y2C9Q8_ARAVE|nr:hypothetical protein AVEN_111720-1 [Araneus ventricosus]
MIGNRWPRWRNGKDSALGSKGFQVRKLIPLKIRRVLGLLHVKSYVGGQMSSRWCGVEVWKGGVGSGVVHVIWPRFKITSFVPK